MQNRSHASVTLGQKATTAQPGVMRTYEYAALRADGAHTVAQARLEAFPMLDAAFSAFAQGALLSTPQGPIAIEDLQPGDYLDTSGGEAAQVTWIGSTVFAPVQGQHCTSLVRIMADTFGPSRPASFVNAGPGARVLQSASAVNGANGDSPLFTPVDHLVDSVNVIEVTPPTPIRLFHIRLTRHAAIDVSGLRMETFHPGGSAAREMTMQQRAAFLSVFPDISHLSEFGPLAHPRASTPTHEAA